MPDLYLPETLPDRIKRRAFKIEIENPSQGNKTVFYHQKDILLSGAEEIGERRVESMQIPFMPDIATKTITVNDPVTGQTVTFSGAAVAIWIEQDYYDRASAQVGAP